mgnify:CR=1 FL=1
MARYVAKNVVAAGFCDRCEVSIAYAISGIYPEAVQIQTFCSEHIDRKLIDQAVAKTFSFAVGDIIRDLDLRRPQFRKTAVYGHFGREDRALPGNGRIKPRPCAKPSANPFNGTVARRFIPSTLNSKKALSSCDSAFFALFYP